MCHMSNNGYSVDVSLWWGARSSKDVYLLGVKEEMYDELMGGSHMEQMPLATIGQKKGTKGPFHRWHPGGDDDTFLVLDENEGKLGKVIILEIVIVVTILCAVGIFIVWKKRSEGGVGAPRDLGFHSRHAPGGGGGVEEMVPFLQV